jgi:hypothetical protein
MTWQSHAAWVVPSEAKDLVRLPEAAHDPSKDSGPLFSLWSLAMTRENAHDFEYNR